MIFQFKSQLTPKERQPYTTIYLIRHCNPDYSLEGLVGSENMPLSVAGLKQRKSLTKKLLTLEIDRVYSSELKRSKETAALFAKQLGKRIIVDARFNEIDWLEWHRVKFFHIAEKNRHKHLKGYQKMDKQLDEIQITARLALTDIFKKNRGKTVAVFSHGNLIKAVLTGILDADIIGFLSLEVFQSSISKLVIDKDGVVKINFINSVDHLKEAPQEDLFVTLKD
ncbi:MAG: histidine phosphatase family protein [Candidatus Falkowbacteria bacterium]|nr:histidine phosphatase family protein [Candidatus Falkowbacteria bacterium]